MDYRATVTHMARPKRTDRSTVATETLALRLTADDRGALDRLVAAAQSTVADTGAELTAAAYVRALIRREAKRLDVGEAMPAAGGQDEGRNVARTERRSGKRPHAPIPDGITLENRVRALLAKAGAMGITQSMIARQAGLDPSALSRWVTRQRELSGDQIAALLKALKGWRLTGERAE